MSNIDKAMTEMENLMKKGYSYEDALNLTVLRSGLSEEALEEKWFE
jgi:hypothetical protein